MLAIVLLSVLACGLPAAMGAAAASRELLTHGNIARHYVESPDTCSIPFGKVCSHLRYGYDTSNTNTTNQKAFRVCIPDPDGANKACSAYFPDDKAESCGNGLLQAPVYSNNEFVCSYTETATVAGADFVGPSLSHMFTLGDNEGSTSATEFNVEVCFLEAMQSIELTQYFKAASDVGCVEGQQAVKGQNEKCIKFEKVKLNAAPGWSMLVRVTADPMDTTDGGPYGLSVNVTHEVTVVPDTAAPTPAPTTPNCAGYCDDSDATILESYGLVMANLDCEACCDEGGPEYCGCESSYISCCACLVRDCSGDCVETQTNAEIFEDFGLDMAKLDCEVCCGDDGFEAGNCGCEDAFDFCCDC